MQISKLFFALSLASQGLAGYTLADDFMSGDFFSKWNFFTGDDPTHGYVNYVDQGTAQNNGYISRGGDGIYIGVDYKNRASGRGRNSVRISSRKAYTHFLTVIDVSHMPGGICGTWPAFWSFGSGGSGWPSQGEIDIIEGANDQSQNYMTLHSSSNCAISGNPQAQLRPATQNCDANVGGNVGCSFHDTDSHSYGSNFNANGGGTYATEWSSNGINIWFWPRGSAPSDALGSAPNPANWGTPTAKWAGTGCSWDSHFQAHNLVFDTTFCGDWAGNTFQSCSARHGGQSCQAYVQNNPSAFKDAYWKVKALKVYQSNGQSQKPTAKAPTHTTKRPAAQPQSTKKNKPSFLGINSTGGVVFHEPTKAPAPLSKSIQFLGEGSDGAVVQPGPTPHARKRSHLQRHALRKAILSH